VRGILVASIIFMSAGLAFAANDAGGGGKKESASDAFTRQQTEKLLTNQNAPKGGAVDTRRVGQPNQSTMDKPKK